MELLKLLAEIRNPILNYISLGVTFLGEGTVFITILCLIFWCIDKKFAYRLGIIYTISGLVVQTLKIVFCIPRPWVRDTSFKPVTEVKRTATGYSFPSGHTQNMTSLYSSFAFISSRKWIKCLCYFLIAALMFSRMYLGAHTLTDVSVSFAIALFISLVINYYAENYSLDSKHLKRIIMFLFIFPLFTLGFGLYTRFSSDTVVFKNLLDVFKSSGAAFGFLIGYLIERKYIRFNERATTLPLQILKYVLGMIMVIMLKLGFDLVIDAFFSKFVLAYFISNFILTLFIICVYPLIIKKFFTNEYLR